MEHSINRADIVASARDWLSTPYQHQASVKHAGTDCLGLVRGIFRELYGEEPISIPAYSPDWAEQNFKETILEGARACLIEKPVQDVQPGDVLVFRILRNGPAKHLGILVEPDRFIHAYAGRHVCETFLVRWWHTRMAAVFSFPNCKDG